MDRGSGDTEKRIGNLFGKAAEAALIALKNEGIEVVMATDEQTKAVSEGNVPGVEPIEKRKSAPKTASPENQDQPTVVSSADGAKILKDLDKRNIERIRRQAEREGGQLLILPSDNSKEAGALSSLTDNLSSAGKDTQLSGKKQGKKGRKAGKAKFSLLNRAVEEVSPVTAEEAALRDYVIGLIRRAGIEVIADVDAGQRVLDRANDKVTETKVRNNLESGLSALFAIANGAEVVRNAMYRDDISQYGGDKNIAFYYGNTGHPGKNYKGGYGIAHIGGKHGANTLIRVLNVIAKGYIERYQKGNRTLVLSDGEYEVVLGLTRYGNKETWLFNGWRKDERTGAIGEVSTHSDATQVNPTFSRNDLGAILSETNILKELDKSVKKDEKVKESRVYHGSAANFDHFDHSHMGEGEGAQAYGWGSYVTEVEGIGKKYASMGMSERYKENRIVNGLAREILESNNGDKDASLTNLRGLLEKPWSDKKRVRAEIRIIETGKFLPEGKAFLYTVDVPDNDGLNYIDYTSAPANEQLLRIGQQLEQDGWKRTVDGSLTRYEKGESKIILNPKASGADVYEELKVAFGSAEDASRFLSSIGFAGISYPAQHMSGGRSDKKRNYVIFNEKDLKITDKVRFFRTASGEAYGFTVGGKIYIDPRIAKADTPIHEYTHLWAEALRSDNPKEWRKVVELMKGTRAWESVESDYPDLETDDEIAEEALAHFSGKRGADRLRKAMEGEKAKPGNQSVGVSIQSAFDKVKEALRRFWKSVSGLMGIRFTSAEEVADKVMGDLLSGYNPVTKTGSWGKVRMSVLGKDAYARKAMYAERRNIENESVLTEHGGTEEQADALANLARARHELHTHMDAVVKGDSDYLDEIIKANDELQESGLPVMDFVPLGYGESFFDDIDTMEERMDYLSDVYDMPDSDSDEFQGWYDENYRDVYRLLSDLNDRIEDYLGEIDKRFGTGYRPTGASRIFSIGKSDETLENDTDAKRLATEAVLTALRNAGIEVVMATDEQTKAALEGDVPGVEPIEKRKSAPKTVSPENQDLQAAISSADGAKILKDLDGLIEKHEKYVKTKEKTFIGEVATALGIRMEDESSKYRTFETVNGRIVTIRLSNHNATVSNFDKRGELDGISIVISPKKNTGVNNDGEARVTEFYYDSVKLRKAEGKPLVEILKSIKQFLYSGEYKDTTGLAKQEEVNAGNAGNRQAAGGTVYGWTAGGKIYLAKAGLNPGTPIHEYTHLWAKAMMLRNPEGWRSVKELLRGTPAWDEVLNDPNYSDIREREDAVASEALSRISGKENARRMEREAQKLIDGKKGVVAIADAVALVDRMRRALSEFWNWVGTDLFGIKRFDSTEEVTDRVLYDLVNGTDVRSGKERKTFTEAEIDKRFNEELSELTEKNADTKMLNLGSPSSILLSAGVADKPMKLYGNKVIKKMRKHGFNLDELKDLPSAVADPIAVFNNYQRAGNRSILTILRSHGRNIMVAITLGKNGVDVDFNIVSSIFGKGENNIVNWINRGYLTYINKEKALNYLHFSESGIPEASNKQELSSATKIVNDFVNPNIGEEKKLSEEEAKPKMIKDVNSYRIVDDQVQLSEKEQNATPSVGARDGVWVMEHATPNASKTLKLSFSLVLWVMYGKS